MLKCRGDINLGLRTGDSSGGRQQQTDPGVFVEGSPSRIPGGSHGVSDKTEGEAEETYKFLQRTNLRTGVV